MDDATGLLGDEIVITKQEVIDYILSLKDRNETHELWTILAQRNKQLEQNELLKFCVNDKVAWESNKRGCEMQGIITKMNRQSISVKTEQGIWRVSPSLLRKVSP